MKFFKSIEKNWRRASNALGGHKVRKALHLRGKNFQSALKMFSGKATNSASAYSGDVYGPTGSIVGRY